MAARVLLGDEDAFTQLVDRHSRQMLWLARTIVREPALAEEVLQETWLAVFQGLKDFEHRSRLKTWLFRIVTNRARTRAQREARSTPMSSLSPEGEPSRDPLADHFTPRGGWAVPPTPWDGSDSPEAILERKEGVAIIATAIAALPPMQAAVVSLRDKEGWTAEEVCEALEISEGNQRVLLHRARTAIRAALDAAFSRR
ncbi:MAG: sigma-70 family RNA polymerase sigma factor [Myxococcota bacterium]